jgi:hypothetical protein
MIHLTASTSIMLAIQPVDFRMGIDGLVAQCRHRLKQNPQSGTLYLFINRAHTMVRVLVYDQNGYWLMTKRLSRGRYHQWPHAQVSIQPYQAIQLRQLLANTLHSGEPLQPVHPVAIHTRPATASDSISTGSP